MHYGRLESDNGCPPLADTCVNVSATSPVEFLELFAQLVGFGLQLFQPRFQRLP